MSDHYEREPNDRVRELEAELERLRERAAQLESGGMEQYQKAQRLIVERDRLRAAMKGVHLKCAAMPVECPDCGYKWSTWLRDLGTFVRAALRGGEPTVPLDSPDFRPKELEDFSARGYRRINRGKP